MSYKTNLTENQMRLARRFETAGLTTISQAIKAFERRDNEKIENWKQQLAEKEAEANRK